MFPTRVRHRSGSSLPYSWTGLLDGGVAAPTGREEQPVARLGQSPRGAGRLETGGERDEGGSLVLGAQDGRPAVLGDVEHLVIDWIARDVDDEVPRPPGRRPAGAAVDRAEHAAVREVEPDRH